MAQQSHTLGDVIREARVQQGKTLRTLAKELEITPSYLSDIENDRRVPAEPVLREIARRLDLNFDDLMGLAGRFGEQAERYVRRQPLAGQLFRRIAQANLDQETIRRLLDQIEGINKERRD